MFKESPEPTFMPMGNDLGERFTKYEPLPAVQEVTIKAEPLPAIIEPVIAAPSIYQKQETDMSFLGNLFKKKPGGTLVGNLLRGVASNVSGGILGGGGGRVEVGQTMTNNQLAQQAGQTVPTVGQQAIAAVASAAAQTPEGQKAIKDSLLQKAKPFLIGAGVLVFVLVMFKMLVPRKRR